MSSSWNRVEIDLAALAHNFKAMQDFVGKEVRIMAIVKSNAYGHGLVPAARAFSEAGARTFGVAEVEEGVRLRQAGIAGDIIVLLGVDKDHAQTVAEHDLSPVVYGPEVLPALDAAAQQAGKSIALHLKVDLGMGRLGIMPNEVDGLITEIGRFANLKLSAMMTHFPKADSPADEKLLVEQVERFSKIVERHKAQGTKLQPLHIANSAALMRSPQCHFDMVRPGVSLYGCYPVEWLRNEMPVALTPAMRFVSRAIQVKEIPAGHGISYGHRFVTDRPTRLAVIPVGYDDGYLRRLTGKAQVLIQGRRVLIRGMICMNACMADVTDLPEVHEGDEVVVMGRQGEEEITATEIAGWSETINYEILCLFGACNERLYTGSDE